MFKNSCFDNSNIMSRSKISIFLRFSISKYIIPRNWDLKYERKKYFYDSIILFWPHLLAFHRFPIFPHKKTEHLGVLNL